MTAERELIAGIRARARRYGTGVRLGIGDDCAVLAPRPGYEMVVTTDMLLEGRHFRREWHSPESVGHRCLARGLSDIAAMGARPMAAFLSIAVPAEMAGPGRWWGSRSWVERFLDGLLALAGEHQVTLAGGDTGESPAGVLADIVVMGEAPKGKAVLRSGARAGDLIYVTGALGGAAAELARLEQSLRWRAETRKLARAEGAAHPHFFPQPRMATGRSLRVRGLATAMIDVSDGLSTDLDHLCEESKLRAEVDVAAVPVHALAVEAERRGWTDSGLGLALNGGEDYELLFTARPGTRVPKTLGGVAVRAIGRMLAANARQPRMVLRHGDGRVEPLAVKGWEHFGKA